MKQFSEVWVNAYYDSIMACVERYQAMTTDSDLTEFLAEFNRDVPLLKLDRWLGYVQGVLIERKATTVQTERDWTRKYFRPLDFCSGFDFDVGDYVIINDGMGEANFGHIIAASQTSYRINCRYGGKRRIGAGDVHGKSSPEEANRYHFDRSGGSREDHIFDNGEVYAPPSAAPLRVL